MTTLPDPTTTRITLGPPYEAFWVDVYEDPEMGIFEDLLSGKFDRVLSALAAVTKSSNAVQRDGEPADLSTVDGWRRQRRSFTLEVIRRIRGAWDLPKENSTASPTPSSPVAVESPTTTT